MCLGGIDKSAAVLRSGARARCGTLGCLTGMAGIDMAGTAAVADASHSTVAAAAAAIVITAAVIVAAAAVIVVVTAAAAAVAAAVAIAIGIEDDVWGSGEALTSGSSRWQMWMLTSGKSEFDFLSDFFCPFLP